MPWVDLERYRSSKIALTKRDLRFGGRGYKVKKNAYSWAGYFLALAVSSFVGFGALVGLRELRVLPALPRPVTVILFAAVATGVVLYAVIGYRARRYEFLLLTPHTVFHSEIQHWYDQIVDPIPMSSVTILDSDAAPMWAPGSRVVHLNTQGDRPDKTMTFAAGGDAIAAAWQRLRSA